MNPKIFSEITGNTHGIKFKMMPPIKPKSKKVKIPCTGAGALAENDADNPVCGLAFALVICHADRSSPFGCFAKTTSPPMDDKRFSDDSIGMRKTTSFLFRDSILGWPMTVFCSGSGKKSTAG